MPAPSPANNVRAFKGAAVSDPLPVYPNVSSFVASFGDAFPGFFFVSVLWTAPAPLRPDIDPVRTYLVRRTTTTTPPQDPDDGILTADGSGTGIIFGPVPPGPFSFSIWTRYQTTLGEILSKRISTTIIVA